MPKECFGEYCAFNDDCDRCYELNQYCKMWQNNMFNFKRRRNLSIFIAFIIIVAWNAKIGFDLLKTGSILFAILGLSTTLFFSLALGASIRSRKIAMKAFKNHLESKS